jgi:hypothetical protein
MVSYSLMSLQHLSYSWYVTNAYGAHHMVTPTELSMFLARLSPPLPLTRPGIGLKRSLQSFVGSRHSYTCRSIPHRQRPQEGGHTYNWPQDHEVFSYNAPHSHLFWPPAVILSLQFFHPQHASPQMAGFQFLPLPQPLGPLQLCPLEHVISICTIACILKLFSNLKEKNDKKIKGWVVCEEVSSLSG